MTITKFNNNSNGWKIFTWVLGNTCNYACSYCPDNLHNNTHPFPKLDIAIDIFEKFRGDKKNKVYYEIVGGEPTLWPKLNEYISHISDENTFIEVNTNGSRTERYWRSFNSKVDFFYISFHPEYADPKQFTKTLEALNNRYRVHVTFLLIPEYYEKCKLYHDYLLYERLDLNINITITTVRKNFSSEHVELTNEMKEFLHIKRENRSSPIPDEAPKDLFLNNKRLNWRKFQSNRLNNFKGMKCNIANERLFISVDGNIYYASCQEGGVVGNVYSGVYNFENKKIICSKDYCGCKFDALASKEGKYNFLKEVENIM